MSCTACTGKLNSETNPIILGKANDTPAIQVKLNITLSGKSPGEIVWVTGTSVPGMLNKRFFDEV